MTTISTQDPTVIQESEIIVSPNATDAPEPVVIETKPEGYTPSEAELESIFGLESLGITPQEDEDAVPDAHLSTKTPDPSNPSTDPKVDTKERTPDILSDTTPEALRVQRRLARAIETEKKNRTAELALKEKDQAYLQLQELARTNPAALLQEFGIDKDTLLASLGAEAADAIPLSPADKELRAIRAELDEIRSREKRELEAVKNQKDQEAHTRAAQAQVAQDIAETAELYPNIIRHNAMNQVYDVIIEYYNEHAPTLPPEQRKRAILTTHQAAKALEKSLAQSNSNTVQTRSPTNKPTKTITNKSHRSPAGNEWPDDLEEAKKHAAAMYAALEE